MKKDSYIERLFIAFAFALFIHLFAIQLLIENLKSYQRQQRSIVEVEYISPLVANSFEKTERTEEDKKEIKKKEENKEEAKREEELEEEKPREEKGQIVYIGETESNKAPDRYKFLAEYNSVVERETKSRYADSRFKNPAPRPQVGEEVAKKVGLADNKGNRPSPDLILKNKEGEKSQKEDVENEERLALKIPRLLKSDRLDIGEAENGSVQKREHSEELMGKDSEFQFGTLLEKGEERHKKRLADLFPQDFYSGRYSGGPFNDWLKDIDEADDTFLNAKEYKYATFFNRIKKSVSQYWDPSSVILKYDPYGNIYGNKDRLTIVKVRIDSSGRLKDVDVTQSSGVEFLDRIAVDAFKSAQPFPNPPKGLMDKNGDIVFNFGFYVEFSKSALRIFRYE